MRQPFNLYIILIDSFRLFVYSKACYIDGKTQGGRIADIYLFKFRMKKLFEIKRFIFYLWLGLPYMFLVTWHDASSFDATFLQALLNNVWRVVYVIVVNFIFFE
jgi:hypothetical protein